MVKPPVWLDADLQRVVALWRLAGTLSSLDSILFSVGSFAAVRV
jgi:hypothetical protein